MTNDVSTGAETAAGAKPPKLYFGRFLRKQGQYGTVAVVGTVVGKNIEYITDSKRRFAKDGTVETQGLTQHVGLLPGDWVEFDVTRNTRAGAPEYKVVHLKRIPRYAVLPEGSDTSYRALLLGEGWRGDRRPGLWALRLPDDRVAVVELELGKDGALRLPGNAARSVGYYQFSAEAVVRLDIASATEEVYLSNDALPLGYFDWSDEADHVIRVIRSLSDANDPQISDIIAWLELHREMATGQISATGVDHGTALNALRSGEIAKRLSADRELMKVYLEAAIADDAVAAAVAEYAREGHAQLEKQLLIDLQEEIASRRAMLFAKQEEDLAEQRLLATASLDEEIGNLRAERLSEMEEAIKEVERLHAERMSKIERDYQRHQVELDEQRKASEEELEQIYGAIADATSALAIARESLETERTRERTLAAEVDRLLSVSERLSTLPVSAPQTTVSEVPFLFLEREAFPIHDLPRRIDGLAILSQKGRDLLRRLIVLMLSGEVPILFGTDALDFVRVAGSVVSPGRLGLMRADPTLMSIEDLWARPGSAAPTMMAAASSASPNGSVLLAVTNLEFSGARFWVPPLADFLRSQARPRGLLVCAITSDIEHDEVKALPRDLAVLEIEGVFETGSSFGALTLPGITDAQQFVLDPGPTPVNIDAAARCLVALSFEPGISLAIRIARIVAEAVTMLGNDEAATKLAVSIVENIRNQTY